MARKRRSHSQIDPLAANVLRKLINAGQERRDLDFKLTLDLSKTQDCVELTKDVTAMANTIGGYIIIGVRDKTFEPCGCDPQRLEFLSPEVILDKINSQIAPQIDDLRYRRFTYRSGQYGVIYVPPSNPHVHLFTKDGNYPILDNQGRSTGKNDCAFRKGGIYVRHGPKNEPLTHHDLTRMLRDFAEFDRRQLMERLRLVGDAPQGSEIIVRRPGKLELSTSSSATPVRVTDDPDAPAVRGILDESQPKDLDELLTVFLKAWKNSMDNTISRSALAQLYANRSSIHLDRDRLQLLIHSSLIHRMPVMYWCSVSAPDLLEQVISQCIERDKYPADREALNVAFLVGGDFGISMLRLARKSSHIECERFAEAHRKHMAAPDRDLILVNIQPDSEREETEPVDDRRLEQMLDRSVQLMCEKGDYSTKSTAKKCDILLYGSSLVER